MQAHSLVSSFYHSSNDALKLLFFILAQITNVFTKMSAHITLVLRTLGQFFDANRLWPNNRRPKTFGKMFVPQRLIMVYFLPGHLLREDVVQYRHISLRRPRKSPLTPRTRFIFKTNPFRSA